MNKAEPKTALNIRMEEKVAKKVKRLAKKQKISISEFVRQAVSEKLEK